MYDEKPSLALQDQSATDTVSLKDMLSAVTSRKGVNREIQNGTLNVE